MRKDKRILFLLSILAVLYIFFVYLDITAEYSLISRILKYACIVACFMTATITYEYSYRREDAKLLILGLFFTLVADALFMFASAFEIGIICFCIVQLCYIRRYKKESFKRNFVMALIIISFCTAGFAFGLKLPYISLLGIVYAVLIITATGLAFRSSLPGINKRLVQAGMILFLLCDTNVAVSFFAPKTSLLYEIASILVWVFYIPSQALLSLSAEYDFNTQASARPKSAANDKSN